MKYYVMKFALGASIIFSTHAFSQSLWQESYSLEAAGKYAQAAAAIDPLLRQYKANDFTYTRLGWLYYLQGKFKDSFYYYNQAITLNPKSLEARLGLLLPLMGQLRWKDAAAEARKIIAVSPWDYTAHLRLMACEEAEKNWDELARHAEELTARYPSDVTLLVYLAHAEIKRGNAQIAKAAYARVLERLPSHVEASNYLQANP